MHEFNCSLLFYVWFAVVLEMSGNPGRNLQIFEKIKALCLDTHSFST
ncbi:MAG: hypothetical protein WCG21_04030 [Eubacteriales bacterium]